MKVLIKSFKNFPNFFNSCNFIIHEKSPSLINIQKKKLVRTKIKWITEIKKIKKQPSIFIANEFFDSLAIKQFKKRKNLWFENYVNIETDNRGNFFDKKTDIKKIEKMMGIKIFQNQKFVEYSKLGFKYLRDISKIIKKFWGTFNNRLWIYRKKNEKYLASSFKSQICQYS